jgi:hypothetical protein
MNIFYTYAYLRKNQTPYYIGKGSGFRAWDNRNGHRRPKDKNRVVLLKKNLTEEEAFKHEKYMIAVFGRKDLGTGILHNRTDGGEGCSGYKHTDETLEKMKSRKHSEKTKQKMRGKKRTEEFKNNLSEINTGKKLNESAKEKLRNREISEETRNKMSEKKKGKTPWNKGLTGKIKHSEETKEKMRNAKLGKKRGSYK